MNAKGFIAAWLAGEAVVIWRMVHRDHRMPVPGALLGISLLFAGLALVAEIVPQSGQVVTLTAWGLDIAAFFNALPAGLSGQLSEAAAASAKQQGETPVKSAGAPLAAGSTGG